MIAVGEKMFFNKTKRIFSILLGVLVISTSFAIGSFSMAKADSDSYGLLADGGFESHAFATDGKKGWVNTSGASFDTTVKNTGEYGLKIQKGKSGIKATIALKKDTPYTLSFYHKGTSTPDKYTAVSISSSTKKVLLEKKLNTNEEFIRYSYSFIVSFNGDADLIFNNTKNDSDTYFDDVKIVEDDTQLIVDGGFESGKLTTDSLNGWVGIGDHGSSFSTSPVRSGNKSLTIGDWKSGVKTSFNLKKDVEYVLSLYHSGASKPKVKITTATGDKDILSEQQLNSDSGYVNYSFRFIVDEDCKADLFINNNVGGGSSSFDDITLTKYDENAGKSIISDSDFDKGFVKKANKEKGWCSEITYENSCIENPTGENSYLSLLGTGKVARDYVDTQIELTAGKEYVLTFYHMGPAGARVDISSSFNIHKTEPDILNYITTNDNEYFTKYTQTFVYEGTTQNNGVSILFIENTVKQNSYFDDVTIELSSNPRNTQIIVDSGFEKGDFVTDASTGWKNVESSVFKKNNATDNDAHTGDYCLYIPEWKKGAYTYVKLEAKQKYALSLYHKGNSPAKISISTLGGTADIMSVQELGSDGGVYRKYIFYFISPDDCTAKVLLDNYVGNGQSYFDDITLVAYNDNNELVIDSGFENDGFVGDSNDGWIAADGKSEISGEGKYSDYNGLILKSDSQGVSTSFELEAGKKYKLNFFHKGKAGSSVRIKSAETNDEVFSFKDFNNDETFKVYSFVFASEKSGPYNLLIDNISGDNDSYFDDVSVREKNVELIANGKFNGNRLVLTDNNDIDWSKAGKNGEITFENNSANLKGNETDTAGIATSFNLKYGKQYELRIAHKGDGNSKVLISTKPFDSVFPADVFEEKQFDKDTEYKEYTYTFKSNISGTATLYLLSNGNSTFNRVSLILSDFTENYQLISDPDCESGEFGEDSQYGWIKTGGASNSGTNIDNENTLNDKSTFKILDWKMGFSTAVDLVKDKEYVLSFYHKAAGAGATLDIATSWTSHITTPDILDTITFETDKDFTRYTYVFKSPKTCRATIYFSNEKAAPFSWFGDISLYEVETMDLKLAFERDAVAVEDKTKTSLKVSWKNVSYPENAEVDYKVYCSDKPINDDNIKDLTVVGSANSDNPYVTVSGLKEATLYYFAIEAIDKSGNKCYSYCTVPVKTKITPKLVNPSFETGDFTGWNNLVSQQAQVNGNVVYDRSNSLVLRDWSTGVTQYVEVNPSSKYVFSFYGYHPGGTMRLRIGTTWSKIQNGIVLTEQTVDDNYEYKKYTVYFETDKDTDQILVFFDNTRGNAENKSPLGFIDQCYLAEIENEDLFFDTTISKIDGADDYLTISFSPVCANDSKENIFYKLYRSENPITEDTISQLIPIYEFTDISEDVVVKDKDLLANQQYYYAVAVSDSNNNTAYIFSDTLKTEESDGRVVRKKDSKSRQDDWDDSDDDIGYYYIIKKKRPKQYEYVPVQRKKTTVSRQLITPDYTLEIILSISGGVLLLLSGVIVFIIIRRRKKNAKNI